MKYSGVKWVRNSVILVLLIGLLVCAVSSAVAADPRYGYTVAKEEGFVVELMETPDGAGKALFTYYPGVRIELLSDQEDGWAHVRVCNIDGYMKSEHVNFGADNMNMAHKLPVWVLKGLKADFGSVNFRELPTVDIPAISDYCIQEKKEVHVMGISDEWFHVNFFGRMGFFKAEYMKDLGKMGEYVIGSFQSPVREQWN